MKFGINDGDGAQIGLLGLAHDWLKWLALGLAALTPFAYGSYPAWVSGFVVALFCILGLAHVVFCLCRGVEFFAAGVAVRRLSYLLLIWLAALVCYDVIAGLERGRVPAISVRELPYAFAFFSAALIGASFGKRQRAALLWVFLGSGALLSTLALVQWLGWDVKTLSASNIDTAHRPTGVFISPNRLAVMLSLSLSTGLAIFLGLLASAKTSRYDKFKRNWVMPCIVAALLLVICGSLVLTLSRLTLMSYGLCLGIAAWIWAREQRRRQLELGIGQLSQAGRVQHGLLVGAPVLVIFAWAAWTLSFGGENLNERIHGSHESMQRLDVLRLSPTLLLQHPWAGWGLGGFEPAFTGVQKAGLIGRWTRMHNDWLQMALECGWPAFALLLLLTAFWLRDWWRNFSSLTGENTTVSRAWLEQLIPMTGCGTVLLCSIGDFPLRETSLALIFFMLAGLLGRVAQAAAGGAAGATEKNLQRNYFKSLKLGVVALPLAAGLGWSAFVAGRNGLACARSPWLGQLLFPPKAGTDLAAWERAIAIDPGDPQLHYYLSLAATQTPHAEAVVYEKGLQHADIAAALSPREYLIQWTAFTLAEKLNRLELADEYLQRAIALFPQDPRMHQDHGIFYLRRWVEPLQPGSFRRDEGVQRAMQEFHWLLRRELVSEDQLMNWMVGAGCTPDEVSKLWEGEGPHECVSRAKYNAEQDQWDIAERELKSLEMTWHTAGTWDSIWYHTLSGTVLFQKSENVAGIEKWDVALAAVPCKTVTEQRTQERIKQQAADFMTAQARSMSVAAVEQMALALAPKLKEYPIFARQLGLQLYESGKNYSAERLLRETAGKLEPLIRLRAMNALQMGDEPAALEHAYTALQLADSRSDVKQWYAGFILEVEARRRRRKEKGP